MNSRYFQTADELTAWVNAEHDAGRDWDVTSITFDAANGCFWLFYTSAAA
jgi:hypothetical protein